MSSRVTRSSARLAAESSAATSSPAVLASPTQAPNHPLPNSRKRKATGPTAVTSNHLPTETPNSPPRRSKRQKVTVTEQPPVLSPAPVDRRRSTNKSAQMAKPGLVLAAASERPILMSHRSSSTADGAADSSHITPTGPESSKRKSSRNKKPAPGNLLHQSSKLTLTCLQRLTLLQHHPRPPPDALRGPQLRRRKMFP